MRADKYSNTPVDPSASTDKPERIIFDDRRVIGISIINASRSDQTLWVGVNNEYVMEPIEPGQTKSLAARDNAYLIGYIALRWDNSSITDETRMGFVNIGMDAGKELTEENC